MTHKIEWREPLDRVTPNVMGVPPSMTKKTNSNGDDHSRRTMQWPSTAPIANGYRGGASANNTTNPLRFENGDVERKVEPLTHTLENTWRHSVDEFEEQAKQLVQCVLDSLTAHVVLLDASAVIVMMNAPNWCRREPGHPLSTLRLAVGMNYITACNNARPQCSWDIGELAAAVRAVLGRDSNKYRGEHRCQDRDAERWFRITVLPVPACRAARAIVSREEITAHKRRDEEHRARTAIRSKLAALSARERQVLDSVVGGKSNKMIAYDLHLSPKTVEKHRANVMRKLQARNVAELVRQIVAAGCTSSDPK